MSIYANIIYSWAPLVSVVKNPLANAGDTGFNRELGKWQPTPVSCLGNPMTEEPGLLQFLG